MVLIGKVLEVWRYPVSSVTGECLDHIDTAPLGIDGDRAFGLVETETGLPARPEREARWHKALDLRSRISAGGITEILIPGSPWLGVLDLTLPGLLTDFFGFPVHIAPYENRSSVPGYSGPWAVNRYEPNALHLLTTASIARLKTLHPAGNPDRRRFRPNVLLEMPEVEGEFPEAGWIGRHLRIGSVPMVVDRPTRRCGFTIIGQDGFDNDPDILRHLVRSNGHNMGVYCRLEQRGRISVGDNVFLD